jgi:hypothetical protein
MGGRHMVDHYTVYNQLGIDAQYSFDRDANEVRRQKFNRPTGKTRCVVLDSKELPSKIDDIQNAFPSKRNMIVWLDYTGADRRTQLQEAVQTLLRLQHGDVFRITLNAHMGTLPDGRWKEIGAQGPLEYRADLLRSQLSTFMPTGITRIGDNDLPSVLAACVELAAKEAESQRHLLRITPVLITSYRDGMRMVTVTCAVGEDGRPDAFPERMRWKYACRGWSDIRNIVAPVLSSKERHRLDRSFHRGPNKMLASLGFLPSVDKKQSLEALRSYRDLHRYYPTFRRVED